MREKFVIPSSWIDYIFRQWIHPNDIFLVKLISNESEHIGFDFIVIMKNKNYLFKM